MRARGRGWPAVVVAMAMTVAACSGGGGSGGVDDDLALVQGESVVQFEGASKLRMGGTLAMPDRAGGGPVGAVLIVPSIARNDRNGFIDVVPGDPLYEDLSKAITAKGLAAFRYDRRGMGTSTLENGQQVTFDDMVTDARQALRFLSQRSGVDASNLAIVGHDVGGLVSMRVAATADAEAKVKSIVLLSAPGRPLVDVMAANFQATFGAESAESFRGVIATLLATGALPERTTIRPEHQPSLPVGQDGLLAAVYAIDPVAEAAKVAMPTLVVSGAQSPLVNPTDGDRLRAALPAAQAFTAEATASLQRVVAPLPQSFDASEHRAHGGGRPPETATRDQAGIDSITSFLGTRLASTRQ